MLCIIKTILVGALCWLPVAGGAAAQSAASLAARLRQAKEVILVSHEDFRAFVDSAGHSVPVPPFVVGGRPNPKFYLKSRTLTPAERTRLSFILTRPYQPGVVTVMHCCMPHHTIYLVEAGTTRYFDFCLGCRCLSDSRGIRLPEFDNRRWQELDKFVDTLGMTYSGL